MHVTPQHKNTDQQALIFKFLHDLKTTALSQLLSALVACRRISPKLDKRGLK